MGETKSGRDEEARRVELEHFAASLGIVMRDIALLDRALTHASAVDASGPRPNYEALEFVGDAALGLAVTHCLYNNIPNRTPGEYSKIRASVVNRRTLARVAATLALAPVIRLGKGEERAGGRQRKALLADCVEALIGAIYIDQGWEPVRSFVERTFAQELEKAQSQDRIWDYKSRLQTYCQAQRIELPQFVLVQSSGPEHRKEFEVEVTVRGMPAGRGTGTTKKEAEQNAAKVALRGEKQLPG
jgi:ribonuclease-3